MVLQLLLVTCIQYRKYMCLTQKDSALNMVFSSLFCFLLPFCMDLNSMLSRYRLFGSKQVQLTHLHVYGSLMLMKKRKFQGNSMSLTNWA